MGRQGPQRGEDAGFEEQQIYQHRRTAAPLPNRRHCDCLHRRPGRRTRRRPSQKEQQQVRPLRTNEKLSNCVPTTQLTSKTQRSNNNNNSNSNAASSAPSSSSSPSASGPFPIGSWTFTTFLDTVSANCTSNPSSWKCEPSVTYATSPTNAQAPFNWIISSADPDTNPNPDSGSSTPNSNLTISSTDNPFAINFSNATLRLVDAGTPDERYTFSTMVQKAVFPTFNVKCFYNDTVFIADLYTSKANSYPTSKTNNNDNSSTGAPGGAFADWRFAMDAKQYIGGGVDVPACYSLVNGQPADHITSGYSVMPPENFCSCAYKNYDP